jgi:mannitol/fructose-specific phosphotransferase system IIA component (Ntr-type)
LECIVLAFLEEEIMQFSKYLGPSQVLVDVEAQDKWALLGKMVDALMTGYAMKKQPHITRETVLAAVLEREKGRSTGMADGFAYPHARLPEFKGIGISVALLKTPLDFGSLDGKASGFVVMVVVPTEQPQVALKLMSLFAGLLQDHMAISVLSSVKDTEALSSFLAERTLQTEFTITAKDIMTKPFADVYPDTPLQRVTSIMLEHVQDSIAIIERDGTLVGEITCDDLFKYGMPDFFTQLKSVSFIDRFDPFEKYFEKEARALARDVMSTTYSSMTESATLLEIVFELAVHHRMKIHIVRDGKRVGVIDRIAVLDRVLNL